MAEKRKDNKGRILRDNEFQQKDGRYLYRYYDTKHELKSVYSWRLVETDRVPNGKRQCECLREMEKKINKDVDDGIIVQKKTTLDVFFADYIETRVLKQSTRTNYKYMYNKYISPVFGAKNISTIKNSDIKKFMLSLVAQGFKPNSVEVIYTILHPIFGQAVKDDYIRKNPADGIMQEIKQSTDWTKKRKHALTENQQSAFVDFVANNKTYSHWLPLFTCLLGTGCRIGEMLGLRWEDIDFKDNIININHNLIYRLQDSGKCEFHITTPKTEAGTRIVPMFDDVRKAFMQERMRQMQENGFCKDVIDGYTGFIWVNRFGQVQSPHCVNRAIKRVVRDYNEYEKELAKKEHRQPDILPDFSAHILRHTFCTRLCENETDLKLIQEIMGHADITTTMDIYNESNTDRKKASFERLEGVMKIC